MSVSVSLEATGVVTLRPDDEKEGRWCSHTQPRKILRRRRLREMAACDGVAPGAAPMAVKLKARVVKSSDRRDGPRAVRCHPGCVA